MAVLAPTPNAMVKAAVSAKTGLFRRVRPANARSCNDILLPHSWTVAALRILPLLSPIGFAFLRECFLWECGNVHPEGASSKSRTNQAPPQEAPGGRNKCNLDD